MRSRNARWSAAISTMLILTACGGGKVREAEKRPLKDGEARHGAMTNGGDKLEVDCSVRFDIPKRADDSRADDIKGLRLGAGYDTAIRYAQCPDGDEADSVLSEGFGPEFSRDARGLKLRTSASVALGTHPEKPKRVRTYFDREPGDQLADVQSVWQFVFDGMPGKETLYGMWRTQPFKQGEEPTVASQIEALTKKYGAPTTADPDGRKLYWIQLPDGKPVPAFDRDRIRTCSNAIRARSQSFSFSRDCGRTITAEVDPTQSLQQARAVHVAVFDPAKLFDYQNHRFEAERDAIVAAQTAESSKNAKGGDF